MDRTSIDLLKIFASRKSLSLNQIGAILNRDCLIICEPINYLLKLGFLRIEPEYASLKELSNDGPISLDCPLEITFAGRVALENVRKQLKEKRTESTRYWITTAIAIAAFIKSFFF